MDECFLFFSDIKMCMLKKVLMVGIRLAIDTVEEIYVPSYRNHVSAIQEPVGPKITSPQGTHYLISKLQSKIRNSLLF